MALSTNNVQAPMYYKKRIRPAEVRNVWLGRIFLWIVIIAVLFPLVAVIAASLAKGEAFSQAGRIFPESITFDNYSKVLKDTNFMTWIKNSLILCTAVAFIQILITLPASFAFSRLKFFGKRNGLMSLLILQMFPAAMALPAILAIAYRLDFMDNLGALVILMCGGSAYNIWLLKGFIDGIPRELDEAAYVDGATTFQTFVRIIVPLTRSMLAVMFVFSFVGTYSEFLLTSALIKDPGTQTVAIGLRQFINNQFSTNWTQFAAAAVMASLPVVIVFSLTQKFIAEGLVAGAVKG
jgi:arabinogalactan oligomer/maltooligosaccharide transport system permease protein